MARKIEWTKTSVHDRFEIYQYWVEKYNSDSYSKKLERLFDFLGIEEEIQEGELTTLSTVCGNRRAEDWTCFLQCPCRGRPLPIHLSGENASGVRYTDSTFSTIFPFASDASLAFTHSASFLNASNEAFAAASFLWASR